MIHLLLSFHFRLQTIFFFYKIKRDWHYDEMSVAQNKHADVARPIKQALTFSRLLFALWFMSIVLDRCDFRRKIKWSKNQKLNKTELYVLVINDFNLHKVKKILAHPSYYFSELWYALFIFPERTKKKKPPYQMAPRPGSPRARTSFSLPAIVFCLFPVSGRAYRSWRVWNRFRDLTSIVTIVTV